MPRVLALDWDHREIRCLLASTSGGRVKLHLATAAALDTADESGHRTESQVGTAVRALLGDQRLGRVVTVVGVNRASVELFDITLPPAKDSELPELVLHQVMHESSAVTEDSTLDFFTLDPVEGSESRRAVAGALLPEQRERIMATCQAAGLKPNRIVVRSFASASLFQRTLPAPQRVCLLVDRVGDEADLTLMVEGRAVFLRTVRLPAESDPQQPARLLAEIRRTLAVALEKHGCEAVEAVHVFGRQSEQHALVERIRSELGLHAAVFDVFHAAGVPPDQVPHHASSFAALLGMVLDEARSAHAIDFLRVRKSAGPSRRQRNWMLGAAAGLLLLLTGGWYVWDALDAVDVENAALRQERKELDTLLKKGSESNKVVEAVHEWQAGDVDWLDELRDLSIRFPGSRDMIVTRMALAATPKSNGGEIQLQGVVRDPSVVKRMEDNVRDKYHEVRSKRVQERVRQRMYSWQFQTAMDVERRDKSQFTSHLPEPSEEVAAAGDKKTAEEAEARSAANGRHAAGEEKRPKSKGSNSELRPASGATSTHAAAVPVAQASAGTHPSSPDPAPRP